MCYLRREVIRRTRISILDDPKRQDRSWWLIVYVIIIIFFFSFQINISRRPTRTLRPPSHSYRAECVATKRLGTIMASRRAKVVR